MPRTSRKVKKVFIRIMVNDRNLVKLAEQVADIIERTLPHLDLYVEPGTRRIYKNRKNSGVRIYLVFTKK